MHCSATAYRIKAARSQDADALVGYDTSQEQVLQERLAGDCWAVYEEDTTLHPEMSPEFPCVHSMSIITSKTQIIRGGVATAFSCSLWQQHCMLQQARHIIRPALHVKKHKI